MVHCLREFQRLDKHSPRSRPRRKWQLKHSHQQADYQLLTRARTRIIMEIQHFHSRPHSRHTTNQRTPLELILIQQVTPQTATQIPTKSKRNTVLRNPMERARAILFTPKQVAGLFISLLLRASSSISTKTSMTMAATPMTRAEERAYTNSDRKRAPFLAISLPCLRPSSPNNRSRNSPSNPCLRPSNRNNKSNHPSSPQIDVQPLI